MAIDHFSSATEMLAALESKDISSAELTELHISRIEQHDTKLNSIPVHTFDRARAASEQAAAALFLGSTDNAW